MHRLFVPIALSLSLASSLLAGPLNPPAGPVAPTHKTLSEVEPRIAINLTNTPGDSNSLVRLSAPGSYYLTGNLTGVAGKSGIEIASEGVTIDLNGFELVGVPGSGHGIVNGVTPLRRIVIRNGSIRNWDDHGIDFLSTTHTGLHFERLHLSANGGGGINCGGTACAVTDCTAIENSGTGISVGASSVLTACVARHNERDGFYAGLGSSVSGCVAHGNTDNGMIAVSGASVSGCTFTDNGVNGLSASAGVTITSCVARNNAENGFSGTTAIVLINCTATYNGMNGFAVDDTSLIQGCAAYSNDLDGIECRSSCVIRDNTCTSNGIGAPIGCGVHVTGSNTRVESNNCTHNDFGVDIDDAGNVIVRNTCADNTQNFVIAADNIYGPIVNRTAPASAPAVGNSAAGTMGSTDPHANFAY